MLRPSRILIAAAATAGLLLIPLAAADDFGRPAELPLAKQPQTIALGDATQDGTVDVVTTSGSTISLLPGSGGGRFGRRIDFAAGSNARSPVFGDWDGDGDEDLAVATLDAITTFAGSAGSLVRQQSYPAAAPVFLGAADLDGDTKLDLVATSSAQATVSVLLGLRDGRSALLPTIGSGARRPRSPSPTSTETTSRTSPRPARSCPSSLAWETVPSRRLRASPARRGCARSPRMTSTSMAISISSAPWARTRSRCS